MRYALIGCGRVSSNHIKAALANSLDICAVCDIDEAHSSALIEKFGLSDTVKRYTDHKKMLDEESPELVAVATESGYHASIAIDCIEHGCNVIIEKPIALSLADADAVINAAKKNNVKVCACHQNRFNKAVAMTRKQLESGRFGRLLHGSAQVHWYRDRKYYDQAQWRGTWEHDGGALMNQCIHDADLLRWMFGGQIDEVVAYTARLNHDYIEAEDLGLALIRFSNGALGMLEGSVNVYPKNMEETLYVFGTHGSVKLGGKSVNTIDEWHFADMQENESEMIKSEMRESPANVYGFGHTALYADVIDAVKQDREPYVTAKDGRDAVELVLAIYKSSYEKRAVKLPLESASTLDFLGYFDK